MKNENKNSKQGYKYEDYNRILGTRIKQLCALKDK